MITIECFNGLPMDYESFLIRKYDSFLTTCRYVEVYYPHHYVHYILVSEDGRLTDLLLFGNMKTTAVCFNSLTTIKQEVLLACIKKLFEEYPEVSKVRVEASYREYSLSKSSLSAVSDDYILELPSTLDDYYLELGHQTRKHIMHRKEKLLKDFEDVEFVVKYGVDIEKALIDRIIFLNGHRMRQKGVQPGIDEAYKNNIYHYAQYYGCVAFIEIGGTLVAGCIATLLNRRVFLHVIAHDDEYRKYNVGEMCAFFLIQTTIEKGLSTFHFLWGESELKRRFLGKPHVLFSYAVFRRYSLAFLVSSVASFLVRFRFSKYAKPIKTLIKNYRRRRSQEQVHVTAY